MGQAITTAGLTKRFGALTAVDRLDLAIEEGEVFGFLGPNGAGKTTTIRILMGLARPTSGSAHILGLDTSNDIVELHRKLAYVPAETAVWPHMRGSEVLDILGQVHGGFDTTRRDKLCERFDFDPSKRGRAYSRGNRQKLGIIAAFMLDAEVYLLDEPATGLDPLMAVQFRQVVAEAAARGATTFLSSHVLAEVEALCDRVAILRAGRIVELDRVERLRHLGVTHVDLTLGQSDEHLSEALRSLGGVTELSIDRLALSFAFRGSLPELFALLSAQDVRSVEMRSPTLEEVFLGYYAKDGEIAGGPPPKDPPS